MLKEIFQRLNRIDHLIRIKRTGTPAEIAEKTGLSERNIYEYLKIMKDLGAPIKFNRQGYYYGDDGNFVISFMDNDSKSENVTAIDKMQKSRNGVTKGELEQLKEKASLDYDTLAKGLAVSRATLINKKGNDKFTPEISEKIVGLVDVYAYGYQVFGDVDRFNAWMFRPNQALNGEAPFDFVDNQFGREEIKNLIGRIENGVYS